MRGKNNTEVKWAVNVFYLRVADSGYKTIVSQKNTH